MVELLYGLETAPNNLTIKPYNNLRFTFAPFQQTI